MIQVFCGSNLFQIQQELRKARSVFTEQHGSAGLETYSGEQIEADQLPGLLSSVSLFASHRLIVIKYLSVNNSAAEKFVELLETVPEETTVIIVEGVLDRRTAYYKSLKKLEGFHEYSELDEASLTAWIKQVVADEGASIEWQAVRALLEAVGNDQQRLANELQKLAAYSEQITAEHIQRLVEPNPRDSVFELLEAVLGGKQRQALNVLDRLEKAHQDPYQLVNMLIWQVNILSVVASAEGVADSQIAKDAKINPYVVSKTKRLASNMERRRLYRIIDAVAKLDNQLKTANSNPWRALEATILF